MNTALIKSGNPKGGAQVRAEIPTGRYGALAVIVKGTADAGQTLTTDKLGKARLNRYNDQWQAESLDWYHAYNNIKGGWPRLVNPEGGASRITTFIPAGLAGIPNTWDVLSREEMVLNIEFDPELDTIFGANAATYEVRGLLTPGVPETYALFVQEQDVDASGAGPRNGVFNTRNVGAVYLRDPDDVVSQVHFEIDDRVVTGNTDDEFLLDITNMTGRIEATGNDLVEAYAISSGNINEALNESTEYEIQFTGPGRAELTVFAISKDVDAEGSRQRARAYLMERLGSSVPVGQRRIPGGAIPA